jgi:hypothetical protein
MPKLPKLHTGIQEEEDWRIFGRVLVLGSSGILLIIAILIVWQTHITVADVANWSQLIGALLALIALYFAWEQLYQSKLIAKGELMLQLETLSDQGSRSETDVNLRPEGVWGVNNPGGAPSNNEEWAAIDDYMGFFEHVEHLLRAGSIDISDFEMLFGYRIENLLGNEIICKAKLLGAERPYWKLFLDLLARLNRFDRARFPTSRVGPYLDGC